MAASRDPSVEALSYTITRRSASLRTSRVLRTNGISFLHRTTTSKVLSPIVPRTPFGFVLHRRVPLQSVGHGRTPRDRLHVVVAEAPRCTRNNSTCRAGDDAVVAILRELPSVSPILPTRWLLHAVKALATLSQLRWAVGGASCDG
jgi:hypothetical protein